MCGALAGLDHDYDLQGDLSAALSFEPVGTFRWACSGLAFSKAD